MRAAAAHARAMFLWLAAIVFVTTFFMGQAHAALAINSATLNGAASITVAPGASITAAVSETNTSGSNWRGTQITTSGTSCFNNANHDGNGTFNDTFAITAPITAGTYSAIFVAGSSNGCGTPASSAFTLNNAIVVTSPTVLSIVRVAANPSNAGSVSWTVTFSRAVTGVNAADFVLVQTGGVSGGSITSVTGGATVYTVTAATGSGSGSLGLNLVDDDTIRDTTTSANRLGGTGLGNGNFSGPVYTVDKIPPTIPTATITSNNANPLYAKAGDIVTLSFTTSDTNGVQTPAVTIGGQAATVSGGPTSWTAVRTMTAGDTTGNVAFAINVNDTAGNAATPRTTITSGSNVIFDKTPPTVPTVTIASNNVNPAYAKIGDVVTLSFTTSDTNGVQTPVATIASQAAAVSGGPTSWTATRTMIAGDAEGIVAFTIDVKDIPGNAATQVTAVTSGSDVTFDKTAPTATVVCNTPVLCGSANPTGAAQVVWSVTFSESMTGVAANNFTLSGTGTSGTSIASVTGSGSSWTVTANTGADGTLGLNLNANLTSIRDIAGNAVAASVTALAANTYTIDHTAPGVCFSDNFNRATLGPDWATSSSSGSFGQPVIVGNRLRLTNATANVATAAHLDRFFPAAGNKIIVVFDYFSYNGAGRDGVAVALSDASVSPVAGAFGGSLGYAQKSNPGSDCPTAGGCPGFAGGWLGVGLDEFGNFSAATEGRNGGPGVRADSVAVRGSGTNQSGYAYHAGSGTLSPVLDSAASGSPAPGHRYRITIDNTDNVHANVTVERDTTAGYIGYTTIIPTYDAKAISGQAAAPANWIMSYTGATGGTGSIHEVDNLSICTVGAIQTPTLNHVRIVHDGSALTCAPKTVTLKACADASCSSLYLGSVTVDLNSIAGATWSSDPVTFTDGQKQVTLTKGTAGSVSLGGTVTSPAIGNPAAVCYNGGTAGNCTLVYSANSCAFDAVEVGKNPGAPIYTKLAGTPFNVDVLALTAGAINTGFTNAVSSVALVDQTGVAAGTCSSVVLANATSPALPYTFTVADAGRKTFTFNYSGAARDVQVRVMSGGTTNCSSDHFAIRPTSFSVTSTNANNVAVPPAGKPAIKAGSDNFELDAASLTNYTGTALINANKLQAHAGAIQVGVVNGSFSAASSSSAWMSKGKAFTYSEVGNFRFLTWGVYDDGSFADVDRTKATPDCFEDKKLGTSIDPGDPNTLNANGMYGCYFGNTVDSAYFGRFIPDHFDVTSATLINRSAQACTVPSTFTYLGEPLAVKFTLTAQNAANVTTKNYTGAFVKLAPAYANLQLAVMDRLTKPATPFLFAPITTGYAITCGISPCFSDNALKAPFGTAPDITIPFAFSRGATAEGDYSNVDVGILPLDSDGVSLVTNMLDMDASTTAPPPAALSFNSKRVATTKLRYGRMRIDNAYGSELLDLPVAVEAQYWNGTSYTRNLDDSCTPVAGGSFSLAAGPGATVTTSVSASGTLNQGSGKVRLSKPTMNPTNKKGSVLLNAGTGLSGFLPGQGTETFGVYKSGPVIYIREIY